MCMGVRSDASSPPWSDHLVEQCELHLVSLLLCRAGATDYLDPKPETFLIFWLWNAPQTAKLKALIFVGFSEDWKEER